MTFTFVEIFMSTNFHNFFVFVFLYTGFRIPDSRFRVLGKPIFCQGVIHIIDYPVHVGKGEMGRAGGEAELVKYSGTKYSTRQLAIIVVT